MPCGEEELELARLLEGIFRKLGEDATEALYRTPYAVSSRPYIERMASLIRAGATAVRGYLERCRGQG